MTLFSLLSAYCTHNYFVGRNQRSVSDWQFGVTSMHNSMLLQHEHARSPVKFQIARMRLLGQQQLLWLEQHVRCTVKKKRTRQTL